MQWIRHQQLSPCCPGNIFSSLTHATRADVTRCLKVNRLGVAEAHTLRVAVAQIAFENADTCTIPTHGAERTCCNAHFAADTQIMVDSDAFKGLFTIYGIFWADFQAGGIFTLLADHGYINAYMFPFDNLDPSQGGIAHAIMPDRTNKLAVPATGALFRIYRQ